MYELHIATESRDKDHLQPRYILLECQAKKHHLLHCSWTGPPASATFKVRHGYARQHLLCNKLILGIPKI